MDVKIDASWKEVLHNEFEKEYFTRLTSFVKEEYAGPTPIYPPAKLIFNAFDHCPFNDVKVVILGQDPYHGAGQANGLCFSVNKGVAFRDAHGIVGQLVLYCIEKDIALDDMTLEEYKAISPVFEEDIYEAISMKTCVEKRMTIGAPSKAAMEKVMELYENYLHSSQE